MALELPPDGERAYRRDLARYGRRVGRLRTQVFASAVAVVATAVAAVGQPWWLAATALAGWYGVTGWLRLRRTEGPVRADYVPSRPAVDPVLSDRLPAPVRGLLGLRPARGTLPRGAVGGTAAERLAVVDDSLKRLLPQVERLHPQAGAELRRAVNGSGPLLRQQVERLAVLDRVGRDLVGSPAAEAATNAAAQVATRLETGVGAYERLLAAAAAVLGAPDVGRTAAEVVAPAVEGMQAYAHGLTVAGGG